MNRQLKRISAIWPLLLVAAVLTQGLLVAQDRKGPKPRRALPPKWDAETIDVFFPDARAKLAGERPNYSKVASAKPIPGGAVPVPTEDPGATASGGFAWSKLIGPETIEDEIKSQIQLVEKTVTTPGPFKGGGYKDARNQFSTLAVMFAVAGEFDGEVRWKKNAPGLRDLVGRAGFNCKVGTDQSYNEAKARMQELLDLVRGDGGAAKPGDTTAKWDQVANRPPLMIRMEEAFDKRLQPALSNQDEFKKNSQKILHEAQILATIGELIQRPEYEFADDNDYLALAKSLRDGAHEIAEAVKLNSYEKARASAGAVSKSCSQCHEGYRS